MNSKGKHPASRLKRFGLFLCVYVLVHISVHRVSGAKPLIQPEFDLPIPGTSIVLSSHG